MHGSLQRNIHRAREIDRRLRRGTDKIVGHSDFYKVCKALWPINTGAAIAALAGRDTRSGERWLSGESDAPPIVHATIMQRISVRRFE